MTIVLELYDVKNKVADINHLKRSVREVLGGRVILTFVIPTGTSARIAVIRDDEIPLDVLAEMKKGGIEARLVLQSPILGISESPEFVRDVLRAYENFGKPGVAAVLAGLSTDYIIEKVGHVLPLDVILTLDEEIAKPNLSVSIKIDKKPKKKRLIHKDGSEEPYDPDKTIETLIKSGIESKVSKKAAELVEIFVEDEFIVDYELDRAVKRALGTVGDHQDIIAYEGYNDFSSRVYIDGTELSVARLMDIISMAISSQFPELKPSPTLMRQLRRYIISMLRKLSSETSVTLHFNSQRIQETVRTILLAEMPYLRSDKPREDAYVEAYRNFNIAKRLLDVDRGEAIRLIERSIEHALRSIALAKKIIPPFGIRTALVTVKDEISESLIKRLKILERLRMPYNRYNLRLINTVLEAVDELLRISLGLSTGRYNMSEVPKIRCPKCGAWVPATYLICPYCGAELVKEPILVAEARSLRERIKTMITALKTFNFYYIKELLLSPVPDLFNISAFLVALSLALPFVNLGAYRFVSFIAALIIRYLILNVYVTIYVKVVTTRKIEEHDVRTETLGLGSTRMFFISLIILATGYRDIFGIIGIVTVVYSLAALYIYYKYRRAVQYGPVVVLAMIIVLLFLALRIFTTFHKPYMDIEELVRKYALLNAVQHDGKASKSAVMKLILGKHPELRPKAREIAKIADRIIEEVNSMSLEEQRAALGMSEIPEDRREIKMREGLPPLPDAEKGRVVVRMAPYPSGPLHIGNARMAILNDEYAKMYDGKLLLVFDDTIGGGGKEILPEAYDRIREDLDRLGVKYHEIRFKSDRVPIYLEYARKLIEEGKAYVCHCSTEEFKKYRESGTPCPHRNRSVEENLEEFERMLEGYYKPGEAVVRLKTPLDHPNPAVRDHVILKIADKPHPRVGDKYRVWPVMDFSRAIDEVLLGITHVIRGVDLIKEDIVEQLVREALGRKPKIRFVHFGKIIVEEVSKDKAIERAVLSKTRIKRLISEGKLFGRDDPRTRSIRSLRERGITAEAIRKVIVRLGLKGSTVRLTPKMVYATNREIVDPIAPRLFFVEDPIEIEVPMEKPTEIKIPKHPSKDIGYRRILLRPRDGKVTILISKNDYNDFVNGYVRLKMFMNFDHGKPVGFDASRAKEKRAKIIHRVPKEYAIRGRLMLDDASILEGYFEQAAAEHIGDIVQLERLYFAKIRGFTSGILEARVAHK